ncbi:MAG: response regulator [Marinifilaceae bacterium]
MQKIKIAIADDHQMFREGIKALLEKEKNISVCGDASNEEELIKILEHEVPDVVLMDIDMGQTSGIDLTKKIKSLHPDINVLAVSMHGDSTYVVKMMDAGAGGYILKNAGKEEMLKAIGCIAEGATYLSKEVSKVLLESLSKPQKLKSNKNQISLTRREVEVLKLIAQEYSNAEIAEQLFISVRTVDTHRRNLIEKLGAKNTAGLVKYAFKNNLIE